MTGDRDTAPRGLLDTNIIIHWPRLAPAQLPVKASISAVTVAELAASIHADVSATERAARLDLLERVESAFEPLPFDVRAARMYGRIAAAVREAGRSPRARVADQMFAATAAANSLPLFTTNARDFAGLDGIVTVVAISRPRL